MKAKDIFISYNHKNDTDFAETLKTRLELAGLNNVWLDQMIPTGANWGNEISAALNEVMMVVLLVSHASMNSAFITYEWCYAHFGLGKRLYPIILEEIGKDVGVFGCLSPERLQWKNKPSNENEWERIIDEIKDILVISPIVEQAGNTLAGDDIKREVRQQAARELGKHNTIASYKLLLNGLKYQLKPGNGDGVVQKAIAEALYDVGQKRDKEAISLLCSLIEVCDENARKSAIQTLKKLAD
jgi:hypothetical protein